MNTLNLRTKIENYPKIGSIRAKTLTTLESIHGVQKIVKVSKSKILISRASKIKTIHEVQTYIYSKKMINEVLDFQS